MTYKILYMGKLPITPEKLPASGSIYQNKIQNDYYQIILNFLFLIPLSNYNN